MKTWSKTVVDNAVELHIRTFYGHPLEKLVKDYKITERDAREISLIVRLLRGEVFRRPYYKMLADMGVTLSDVQDWSTSWNACRLEHAWRELRGEPSTDDLETIREVALTGQPEEHYGALNQHLYFKSQPILEKYEPKIGPKKWDAAAVAVIEELNQEAGRDLGLTRLQNSFGYRDARMIWTYQKPLFRVEYKPDTLWDETTEDLGSLRHPFGLEHAVKNLLMEEARKFMALVDSHKSRDECIEDNFQENIDVRKRIAYNAAAPEYIDLVNRFRNLLGEANVIEMDGREGCYNLLVKETSDLLKFAPHATAPLSGSPPWEQTIEIIEATQEAVRREGFTLLRDMVDALGDNKHLLWLCPIDDQYMIMSTRLLPDFAYGPKSLTLKDIEKKQPFDLVALRDDMLEFKFRQPVQDSLVLARRIASMCPQVLDYGCETVEELAAEFLRCQRFWVYFSFC